MSIQPRFIVVLERASLEVHSAGHKHTLLNSADHQKQLAKCGRPYSDARPDIIHHCLLALLGSPLNLSGRLQIYIHTSKDVLIEVNPQCRIPTSFQRFCGLMGKLLTNGIITPQDKPGGWLLRVLRGHITQHLPEGCLNIAISPRPSQVRFETYVNTPHTYPAICIVVGAAAGYDDDFADDWTHIKLGVSDYFLCANTICGEIAYTCARAYKISSARADSGH